MDEQEGSQPTGEDLEPIQPIDEWVDRKRYPLAYDFLNRMTNSGVDAKAFVVIRKRPALLTREMAEDIMTNAGYVVINEVLRRLSPNDWSRRHRIPLYLIVHEVKDTPIADARGMIVLYTNFFRRKDGWFVWVGTARSIIGLDARYGDPFRTYPPDLKALEKNLQTLVEEVMASIPMEMMVRYAGG